MLILTFFVYGGQKWAMIATMIYWTFSKGIQLFDSSGSPLVIIIWWTAFMGVFWRAYQVEQARSTVSQEKKKESGISLYCSNCGVKIKNGINFCAQCGEKIKKHKKK